MSFCLHVSSSWQSSFYLRLSSNAAVPSSSNRVGAQEHWSASLRRRRSSTRGSLLWMPASLVWQTPPRRWRVPTPGNGVANVGLVDRPRKWRIESDVRSGSGAGATVSRNRFPPPPLLRINAFSTGSGIPSSRHRSRHRRRRRRRGRHRRRGRRRRRLRRRRRRRRSAPPPHRRRTPPPPS